MSRFNKSEGEDAALKWLVGLGYEEAHGPDIAAGEPGAERTDPGYRDILLERGPLRRIATVEGWILGVL